MPSWHKYLGVWVPPLLIRCVGYGFGFNVFINIAELFAFFLQGLWAPTSCPAVWGAVVWGDFAGASLRCN